MVCNMSLTAKRKDELPDPNAYHKRRTKQSKSPVSSFLGASSNKSSSTASISPGPRNQIYVSSLKTKGVVKILKLAPYLTHQHRYEAPLFSDRRPNHTSSGSHTAPFPTWINSRAKHLGESSITQLSASTKHLKEHGYALIINMKKAYDKVDWNFLERPC